MLAQAGSVSDLSPAPQVHIQADVPQVPPHWTVRQLGRLGRLFKGNGGTKADEVDEGIPCIRYGDIYTQYDFLARATRSCVDSETATEYTRIRYGDILFAASGETLEEIGKSVANLVEGDACCGGDLIVFRPSVDADARFLGYATDCQAARSQKSRMGRGMTVMHIYVDQLKRLWIALPPRDEQRAIADFLDRETEKIDSLVAKKRRLIELLREKRSAAIGHAVTKGLNPDVPMKDSGMAWFGVVPAHWPVVRLGYFARVLNGSTPSRDDAAYWLDGTIPWVTSTKVNEDRVTEPSELITEAALRESNLFLVPAGTVIIGLVGQGRTRGMASLLEIETTTNQNMAAIISRGRIVGRYLQYQLENMYTPIREYGRGANQAALNCEVVASLRVPLPPLDEQAAIAGFLDGEAEATCALAHKTQKSIELLMKSRSALITAAVTGQIDVREYAKVAS